MPNDSTQLTVHTVPIHPTLLEVMSRASVRREAALADLAPEARERIERALREVDEAADRALLFGPPSARQRRGNQ